MASTITACDLFRWAYKLLCKDLWQADKKQDRNALAKPLLSILQEVEGNPVVKSEVSQVFRWQQICLTAGCEKTMRSDSPDITAGTVVVLGWRCSRSGVRLQLSM